MLAIEHKLTFTLEYLVLRSREAAVRILGLLGKVRANGVDRVADEYRLNEAQPVVSIRKCLQPVRRHETDTCTEDKGAGYEPALKQPFLHGENVVGDVRMEVHDERVERHAFAFGDRPADRSDPMSDFEIFPVQVFASPEWDRGVFRWNF